MRAIRLRRIALGATAAALLSLGAVPAAGAASEPILVASCDGPPEGVATAPGVHRFAQTFSPRVSGRLATAALALNNAPGSSGDWVVQVLSALRIPIGAPSDQVLTSATIPDSAVPTGTSTIAVRFPDPPRLAAGAAPRHEYELVVTRPGSADVGVGYRTGDDCTGQLFTSTAQTGSFAPFGTGTSDMVFRVLVTDDVPPQTRIAAGPRRRTTRRRARFELRASEPVAGFECRLDRGSFDDCDRAAKLRVGPGRHRFKARATDAAGNVDPTPAKAKWKVLR